MAIHLLYFEDRDGNISLPPTSDTPCPPAYQRCEANTIAEVESLERRMQQASRAKADREGIEWEQAGLEVRRANRRSIMTAIESASTDQYTKDFLREWCKLRDESRRAKYKEIFQQREGYFEALHNDKMRNAEELLGEPL
jgi:hypothetical protein